MVCRGTVESSREPYPNASKRVNQMSLTRDHFLPGNSPSELKRDPFLFRQFLRHVKDATLKEAERREDTWEFLLGVRGLPGDCKRFFKACASVSRAMVKLTGMQIDTEKLNRSLLDEMLEARATGDMQTAEQRCEKLCRAYYRHGLWDDLMRDAKDENVRIQLNQMRTKIERTLRKQTGRNWKPTVIPDQAESERRNKAEFFTVHSWLRWGRLGEPGLCFYSDKALTDLLDRLLESEKPNDSDNPTDYRKMRQRLGLRKFDYQHPLVTTAHRVAETGLIEITLREKGGDKKRRLSADDVCMLGGEQFYPILP